MGPFLCGPNQALNLWAIYISYSLNSLKVFLYGILVEYQRVIKGNTRSLDCSSSAGVAHSSSMIDSFSHQVGPKEVQADLMGFRV